MMTVGTWIEKRDNMRSGGFIVAAFPSMSGQQFYVVEYTDPDRPNILNIFHESELEDEP